MSRDGSHSSTGPGFIVLYRWRLHPGKEHSFVEAWSAVTRRLLKANGSLGSRLHRGPEDIWYAYAQWENADARRRAFEEPVDAAIGAQMSSAIAETYPELILECVADLLKVAGKDFDGTA
jgi:quinol monooxygenase YgiN